MGGGSIPPTSLSRAALPLPFRAEISFKQHLANLVEVDNPPPPTSEPEGSLPRGHAGQRGGCGTGCAAEVAITAAAGASVAVPTSAPRLVEPRVEFFFLKGWTPQGGLSLGRVPFFLRFLLQIKK